MAVEIRIGDALEQLRELPDESVHCCVSSPPYWGLRDYGTGTWEGGEPDCDHLNGPLASSKSTLQGYTGDHVKLATGGMPFRDLCARCGARRIDQQIGLEETPDEWCARLVEVFREVKRVLRSDGTLFCNVGDSYAGSWGNQGRKSERGTQRPINGEMITPVHDGRYPNVGSNTGKIPHGSDLKPKDLIGQPWLLAFALRADGWFLRDAIVWAKPNPMPESVRDRCTNAYEHVFLLAKNKRYFFDAEAIKEQAADSVLSRSKYMTGGTKIALNGDRQDGDKGQRTSFADYQNGRNCRNVWTIATEPSSIDHFAMMPTKLAHRCILAGCPVGGTVLDPFGGAGTTALVADRLQRNSILIELNAETASKARRRIDGDRGDLLDLFEQPKPEQGSLCLVP